MPPVVVLELCIIATFAVLVLAAWRLQRDAIRAPIVRLWALGALAMGGGTLLVVLRPELPGLLSYTVANLLWFMSPMLRAMSLRSLCGRERRPLAHAAAALMCAAVYHCLWQTGPAIPRQAFSTAVSTAGFAYVGVWAWRAMRQNPSPGAALMVLCEGLGLLMQVGQVVAALMGLWVTKFPSDSLLYHAFFAGQTFTFFLSNLGFFGMVLATVSHGRREAREHELREAGRREMAEQNVNRLTELLRQRDAMAAEREQLLRILAHEVRQPLHNAGGVLQGIRWHANALASLPVADLAQRAYRAELVLTEVRDVLDNVLQAAVLLSSHAPLTLQRTELDFLLEMALLDLPVEQREAVQVQHPLPIDSVAVEPNLMRLALRNLLRNAFSHAGDAARVSIVVDTLPGSGGLSIAVCDDGPGMSDQQLQAATQPTEASGLPLEAHSAATGRVTLGLSITRRVMQRHGGRLVLSRRSPRGLCAALQLPQGCAAAQPPGTARADMAQASISGSRNT